MKKILGILLAVTLCFSLAACGNGTLDTGAETTPAETTSAENTPTETVGTNFEDGVLKTSEVEIKITDYKVMQPGETGNEYGDKPVIVFWYECTNISGKETNAMNEWLFSFTAIQDNDPNTVNKLDVGTAPDINIQEESMQSIKKGGTAKGATAYELDDTETPIILIAADILGNEYGRQEFVIK